MKSYLFNNKWTGKIHVATAIWMQVQTMITLLVYITIHFDGLFSPRVLIVKKNTMTGIFSIFIQRYSSKAFVQANSCFL